MNFLDLCIYPRIKHSLLVHDELHNIEDNSYKLPFRYPIIDNLHFIGQVYEYDDNGNEYPKWPYRNYLKIYI